MSRKRRSMTRRDLLQRALLGLAALGLPKGMLAATSARTTGISIGTLLTAAFPEAKRALLGGYDWVHPELRRLAAQGRIVNPRLGGAVTVLQPSESSYFYPIQRVSVPVLWSKRDEERIVTKTARISFVTSLIENAFWSMDTEILGQIGTRRALVSKVCHHRLGEVLSLPSGFGYRADLYTDLFFID